MSLQEEIQRRRTFAIISHPDAGKTTLTEKLLLYSGAIDRAGSVKGREGAGHAQSDWMSIEQERGISVTSAAMQFDYKGFAINLLDTPGHQDFSEDTYRALTAADSVVMLLDCAKGVEEQTKKLFRVASERKLPIFTFVNKLDRPGREPIELIDEVEELFGLHAVPVTWPIGNGPDFKGVYVRATGKIRLFGYRAQGRSQLSSRAARDPVAGSSPRTRDLRDTGRATHVGRVPRIERIAIPQQFSIASNPAVPARNLPESRKWNRKALWAAAAAMLLLAIAGTTLLIPAARSATMNGLQHLIHRDRSL